MIDDSVFRILLLLLLLLYVCVRSYVEIMFLGVPRIPQKLNNIENNSNASFISELKRM